MFVASRMFVARRMLVVIFHMTVNGYLLQIYFVRKLVMCHKFNVLKNKIKSLEAAEL